MSEKNKTIPLNMNGNMDENTAEKYPYFLKDMWEQKIAEDINRESMFAKYVYDSTPKPKLTVFGKFKRYINIRTYNIRLAIELAYRALKGEDPRDDYL